MISILIWILATRAVTGSKYHCGKCGSVGNSGGGTIGYGKVGAGSPYGTGYGSGYSGGIGGSRFSGNGASIPGGAVSGVGYSGTYGRYGGKNGFSGVDSGGRNTGGVYGGGASGPGYGGYGGTSVVYGVGTGEKYDSGFGGRPGGVAYGGGYGSGSGGASYGGGNYGAGYGSGYGSGSGGASYGGGNFGGGSGKGSYGGGKYGGGYGSGYGSGTHGGGSGGVSYGGNYGGGGDGTIYGGGKYDGGHGGGTYGASYGGKGIGGYPYWYPVPGYSARPIANIDLVSESMTDGGYDRPNGYANTDSTIHQLPIDQRLTYKNYPTYINYNRDTPNSNGLHDTGFNGYEQSWHEKGSGPSSGMVPGNIDYSEDNMSDIYALRGYNDPKHGKGYSRIKKQSPVQSIVPPSQKIGDNTKKKM